MPSLENASTTPMHMWYETKSGSSTIYRLKSYKIRIFTKILTSSSGRVLDIFKYDWLDANWKRNFWKESEKHLCKNICLPQIYKLNKVLSLGEYFHHFQYYFLLCNIPKYTKINHWMNYSSSSNKYLTCLTSSWLQHIKWCGYLKIQQIVHLQYETTGMHIKFFKIYTFWRKSWKICWKIVLYLLVSKTVEFHSMRLNSYSMWHQGPKVFVPVFARYRKYILM